MFFMKLSSECVGQMKQERCGNLASMIANADLHAPSMHTAVTLPGPKATICVMMKAAM
jgi:galactitol-specific phosphotransferase system IIB component